MIKRQTLLQPLLVLSTLILFHHAMGNSECANLVCLNGGTCYTQIVGDTIRNEYCICPPDKTGTNCADHKPCDLTCVRGKCQYPFTPVGMVVADDVDKEPFCKCDEGFSGILCESAIEECLDNKRTCYNGGMCKESFHTGGRMDGQPFSTPRYKCDCSTIDPQSPYAGLECEHPAEKICSLMTFSKTSFCVNGGQCKDIVTTEDVHRGCDCLPGFEGDHCEYIEGTDPNNPKYIQSSTAPENNNSSFTDAIEAPLNAIEIFLVVIGCIGTFSLGVVTSRRLKKKKDALKETQEAYDENDLAFDADGNRMTNISINGDTAEREGEVI